MLLYTPSNCSQALEEVQWDPEWSEWVNLPEDDAGGTISGDTDKQDDHVSIPQVSLLGLVSSPSLIDALIFRVNLTHKPSPLLAHFLGLFRHNYPAICNSRRPD